MKRKETLESDAMNHSNNVCHPAHDDEQQHLQQQHCCSIATHYRAAAVKKGMAATYKYILVRRGAAYYSIIVIYQEQIKALCCETAHGVYVTKKETTVITKRSSSSGSSTMYACKTDLSIAQTTPQSSSYIYLHWNKKGKCHKKTPSSWIRTNDAKVRGTATCLFTYSGIYMIDMSMCVRIDVWEKMTKKQTQHPPQGDDASTV